MQGPVGCGKDFGFYLREWKPWKVSRMGGPRFGFKRVSAVGESRLG